MNSSLSAENTICLHTLAEEVDEGDEEIDPGNIITGGRRTRGKEIDFRKANEELGDEEDEEDDDDFEEPVDTADEDSKMEE